MHQRELTTRHTIRINDLLVGSFAIWPLFWMLWVSMNVTVSLSSSVPLILIVFLAGAALLNIRKIGRTILFVWLLFFVAIAPSVVRGNNSAAMPDMIVLVCGFLFCLALQRTRINAHLVMRCIYICGLFVAITVLLDAVFHVFRSSLVSIYTSSARYTVVRRGARISTGGIIPHTGSAGGFICSGLGAFYALQKQKKKSALSTIIYAVFILAFFLLQKRGFVLDIVLAVFAIWVLGWRFDMNHRVNLRRQIRFAVIALGLAAAAVAAYYTVSLFRTAVDSLLQRFGAEEDTLSGRTLLYALAMRLFGRSPVLGIGWGNFRAYTQGIFSMSSGSTYEAHNVYLQMLCETGVVGASVFIITVLATLFYGIRKYRSKIAEEQRDSEFYKLQFGLYLQLFFLLYCMSGNPLYDYNFLITYFIGVLVTL